MSFETLTKLVKSQDPVSAGVVNKPLRSIDQNVRYLWELIQAAGIGSTVYARRQSVEAEAHQGAPVWLNPTTQRFERGLATVDVDATTGAMTTSSQAQIWGIVAEKINSTLADILLFGVAEIDISAAVDGTVVAGTYYLSSAKPGYLVKQKPPVSVAVLRVTTDGHVFVMPQFVDFFDRHTHHNFFLTCAPAGDTSPPAVGERHTIDNADDSIIGWLPADHESFEGHAPAGAVFGYNLAAHASLNSVWPPVPLSNSYLEWDRGLDTRTGFSGVPVGSSGLCVMDRYGIWWMSDCYGDVPWPTDLDTSAASLSESASESISVECPREVTMTMRLWFTKVDFATDTTAVLSLHPGDDRIKIRCYGDDSRDGTTGHLELSLDLNLVVIEDVTGYQVLKEFNSDENTFSRGPVCEGVYALSENLQLTGSATRRLVPGDLDSPLVYQGPVGLSVDPENSRELDVQLIRLDGAEEEHYQDLLYIAFTADEARHYRARIIVPDGLAVPNPQMRLRFQILGRAAGTLPALTLTARRVARPDGTTPSDLPTDDFDVDLATDVTLDDANQYVEVESDVFTIAAGDTVYFTLSRAADDGYASTVGVLRQIGVVSSEDGS